MIRFIIKFATLKSEQFEWLVLALAIEAKQDYWYQGLKIKLPETHIYPTNKRFLKP